MVIFKFKYREGDNTILVQQSVKFIFNNLQRKIKGENIDFESLRFLDKLGQNLTKIEISEKSQLHNCSILVDLFEHRAAVLVKKTLEKLSKFSQSDHKMDIWNNSQVFYIQHVAKSYAELFVLREFKESIENVKDNSTKIMLNKFLVLYALNSVENDIGIFRENDFISAEAYDLIKNEITDLLDDLSKEIVSILDVISPPDHVLGSPFGSSDDDVNKY